MAKGNLHKTEKNEQNYHESLGMTGHPTKIKIPPFGPKSI